MSYKYEIDKNLALFQFRNKMSELGLIVDDINANGKLQRCKAVGDKGREKSGYYVLHIDGYPAGHIGNYKTGESVKWKFEFNKEEARINNSNSFTPKENYNYLDKQREKEENLNKEYQKNSLRLEKEFFNADFVEPAHSYLQRKKIDIPFNYLKKDKYNNILIPLEDINGKIWSIQRITQNGDKFIGVLRSKEEKEQDIECPSKKKGCFFTNTSLKEHKEFLICEGFATAMSLEKILDKPVIMAVDAGNLINVVSALREKYPNKQITIFPDNDRKKELQGKENVGLAKAKAIKEKYPNVKIIPPKIKNNDMQLSDYNDLYVKYGKDIVAKQIKECELEM